MTLCTRHRLPVGSKSVRLQTTLLTHCMLCGFADDMRFFFPSPYSRAMPSSFVLCWS